MKTVVRSLILFCASCLGGAGSLQTGDDVVRVDTAPLRPTIRSASPLNPQPSGEFDAWSRALQEEFFRHQAAARSAPVSAFMGVRAPAGGEPARMNPGAVPAGMPADWAAYDLNALVQPRLEALQPLVAAGAVRLQQPYDLTAEVNGVLDRAQLEPRLREGIGELRSWLEKPATAQQVDQIRQQIAKGTEELGRAEEFRTAAADWLTRQADASGFDWAGRLGDFPDGREAVAQLDAAWRRQAAEWSALPTDALLQDARSRLDRLEAAGPAGGLPAAQGLSFSLPPGELRLGELPLGGLNLQAQNLRVGLNAAAVERIEFALGGARFGLSDAAWLQQRTADGGRQSLLSVGPAELMLSGGEFARFTELRFELRTGPGAFRAAGSVAGLDLHFNRQRWQFDAGAFAVTRDPAGLRLQAIVYPHDPRGPLGGGVLKGTAGVYFEATTQNLRMLQEVQAIFDTGDGLPDAASLDRLAALVASRPHLFDDDYRVVFSGRAAQILAAQWGRPLAPGTRLLIDALAGFDNGGRTFAVQGSQVARLSALAADRRYADMVDVARGIVPEIDVLYSHMLQRIAGRPDSLVRPVTLYRLGELEAVLGAANGSYATQWFAGVAWQARPAEGLWSQRFQAGWLYEQSGVWDETSGMSGLNSAFALAQYNFERAGFLQYRANGWVAELETALHPRFNLGRARQLAFHATLDLGLRQADYISFANQDDFARPKEFLDRYDQPSPLGNLFPIFHAETGVQMAWRPEAKDPPGSWTRRVGVGCDADAGYGAVARALRQQLPILPELTPKVFMSFDRPGSRVQLVGAWPTAADRSPYAACQWSLAWGPE